MDFYEEMTNNFYTALHFQLAAQMPRPAGIHIYSTGNMYRNFVSTKTQNGWVMEMSRGVPYSHYAMGFDDSGNKRTPRGKLEKINFKTIKKCIKTVAETYGAIVDAEVVIQL